MNMPKPKEKEILNFSVVEKFKATKSVNLKAPKLIKKEVEIKKKPKVKPKKRKVFGIKRKAQTLEEKDIKTTDKVVEVKQGNTTAKDQDTKKLKKSDEDELPIPADEFLITHMPRVIEEITPNYPKEAKDQGVEGRVVFEILIDPTGKVRQATLLESLSALLDQAAKEAIMQFKFEPAKIEDQKVAVKIKYSINFILDQ